MKDGLPGDQMGTCQHPYIKRSVLWIVHLKKKGGGGTHLLQDFQTHDSQMLCEKNKLAALPFLRNRNETDWYPTFMAAPLSILEKQQRRVCFSELFPSDMSLERRAAAYRWSTWRAGAAN